MATSQELFFDLVRSDELLDAYAIELEGRLPLYIIMSSCPTHDFGTGFPPDEAASLEKFKYVWVAGIYLVISEPSHG